MSNPDTLSPLIREMIEDHKFIRSSIKRIQEVLRNKVRDRNSLHLALNMIHILEDRLASHFKLEEDHGILQDIAEERPRLAEDVRGIIAEHGLMLHQLREIRQGRDDPALELKPFLAKTENAFETFVKTLIHHESNENQLVNEAYNWDIGDKD